MLPTLAVQILLVGLAFGDVNEKIRLGLLPSSSNYPGLEAPLESAAATPQQRTLFSNRNHDEDNLERLCNDPFHSFLCKPVTVRRRRINGRLRPGAVIPSGAAIPSGIVPEASNVQESSQPLESNLDLMSKGKSYLPPPQAKAPKKLTEPQFLPPGISNNERTQESKISYSTVPKYKNSFRPVQTEKPLKKIDDQPQTYGQKLLLEPSNTVRKSKQIQLETKLPRKYLPIDEAVSPDSSNISPSIQNLPLQGLAAQNKERKDESHSLERLCNDPFHSFLCKPGKRRKRIDGRIRPEAKLPPGALIAASSIVSESRVLPSQQRSVRQPSNARGARQNYLPPDQEKAKPTYQNKPTSQDSSGYKYPEPDNNGTNTFNNGYIYEKPSDSSSSSLPDITTESTPQISNTLSASFQTGISQDIVPPSTGYQYEAPANRLTVTTNSPPTTQTLVPNDKGSSNQETANSGGENGYFYPKPSSSASTTAEVLQTGPYSTTSPQDTTNKPSGMVGGYNYLKPSNPLGLPSTAFQTTTTSTLEDSTTKIPVNQPTVADTQTTAGPSSGSYEYPKPTNNNQQSGYSYDKPSVEFTLPAEETSPSSNTLATETTPPPVSITTESTGTTFGYQYPKPSNTQENIVLPNQTGYSYPKPSIGLTYPTTKGQEITEATSSGPAIETTTRPAAGITNGRIPTTGYEYPQPTINHDIAVPSGQQGYNYPKPSINFTYPSEKQSQTVPSTTQIAITTTLKPESERSSTLNVPAASQTGYVYEKPSNSLTLPTEQPSLSTSSSEPSNINQDIVPPTEKPADTQTVSTTISVLPTTTGGYQYPKPSNGQAGSSSQKGYVYDKPEISFTLPDSGSATTAVETVQPTTQATTSSSIVTNLTTGYEYPNPSNDQNDLLTPSKDAGYTYPKPSTSFDYPTTFTTFQSNPTVALTTNAPTTTKPTSQAQSSDSVEKEQNGYSYEKPPLPSFAYPRPTFSATSYTRPLNSFQYPKSNFPQNQGSGTQNGYVYQRPAAPTQSTDLGYSYRWSGNPLTLPPRQRSARNYNYHGRDQFSSFQFPSRRDYNQFSF